MPTLIPHCRRFRCRATRKAENPFTGAPASSERPVLSLALAFDLESGSTWKGLVVPNVKIAGICLRSSESAVISLSAPTTMWCLRLSRAIRRERLAEVPLMVLYVTQFVRVYIDARRFLQRFPF